MTRICKERYAERFEERNERARRDSARESARSLRLVPDGGAGAARGRAGDARSARVASRIACVSGAGGSIDSRSSSSAGASRASIGACAPKETAIDDERIGVRDAAQQRDGTPADLASHARMRGKSVERQRLRPGFSQRHDARVRFFQTLAAECAARSTAVAMASAAADGERRDRD